MKGFEIGQEVVCIKSHIDGITVKGKVYMIKDISSCRCGGVWLNLNISISADYTGVNCSDCKDYINGGRDRIWWQGSSHFVPLQEWESAEMAVFELLDEVFEPVPIEY